MRTVMALALAALLVGCGDRDTDVDFSADEIGPDVHSMVGTDGNVKMGLTREYVYFALSDSARAEARAGLDADAEQGGIKGFFSGLMRGVLGKALQFRAKYPVADIEDIRWQDGRMRILFTDPSRHVDENLQISDDERSISEAFSEDDVREFAEAFRAVKDGEVTAPLGDSIGG